MNDFLDQVRGEMERYFGDDIRRIGHALQVAAYARELLTATEADEMVTMCAAYLHDIGIPEAERKYGSSAGPYQELEGPPVARLLLRRLQAPPELIERVCSLVGSHHTPGAIDAPEFRILWDADALVNLAEVIPDKPPEQIRTMLERSFVTAPGLQRALALFLSDAPRKRD